MFRTCHFGADDANDATYQRATALLRIFGSSLKPGEYSKVRKMWLDICFSEVDSMAAGSNGLFHPALSSQKDQNQPGPSHPSGHLTEYGIPNSWACATVLQSGLPFGRTFCRNSWSRSCIRACAHSPCFEIEQRQLTAFDLPPEVIDVILAARRPSTKTVYACC